MSPPMLGLGLDLGLGVLQSDSEDDTPAAVTRYLLDDANDYLIDSDGNNLIWSP